MVSIGRGSNGDGRLGLTLGVPSLFSSNAPISGESLWRIVK